MGDPEMKHLLLLAFASQAAGCVYYADGEGTYEDALITGAWSFTNIATGVTTDCPAGFGTVRMISQPVDTRLAPIGQPYVDLFDCADGRHTSAYLPPDVYEVWLEVVNNRGTETYAQSTSKIVDVIERDALFSAEILNDGGYFLLDWQLRGARTNTALGCEGIDGVEINATLSGSSEAKTDIFDCRDGSALTAGLRSGAYTLSVSATDASDRAVGTTSAQTSAIRDRNQVTDLGLITIPIVDR
jgi:hypothetical protein